MDSKLELGVLIMEWLHEKHKLPSNIRFLFIDEAAWGGIHQPRKLVVLEQVSKRGETMIGGQTELFEIISPTEAQLLCDEFPTFNAADPSFFRQISRALEPLFVFYGISPSSAR